MQKRGNFLHLAFWEGPERPLLNYKFLVYNENILWYVYANLEEMFLNKMGKLNMYQCLYPKGLNEA